ncbi:MAG: helix-turn-helix domain-containing protein [Jeotgalicoccus sp.]
MIFGEKLKKERELRNWSQEYLAEQIHVSRQSVSKWETGKNYPSIEIILDLSELFGITVDELLKSDEDLKDKVIQDSQQPPDSSWFSSVLFTAGIMLGIILVSLLKNGEINWTVLSMALVFCLSLWMISKGRKKVESETNY